MADIINGSFELVAGVLLWLNVRQILRDKSYSGVSIVPTSVFMAWGYWNLYYYPSLTQWWSFAGGINVVLANTVWVVLMVVYRTRHAAAV